MLIVSWFEGSDGIVGESAIGGLTSIRLERRQYTFLVTKFHVEAILDDTDDRGALGVVRHGVDRKHDRLEQGRGVCGVEDRFVPVFHARRRLLPARTQVVHRRRGALLLGSRSGGSPPQTGRMPARNGFEAVKC